MMAPITSTGTAASAAAACSVPRKRSPVGELDKISPTSTHHRMKYPMTKTLARYKKSEQPARFTSAGLSNTLTSMPDAPIVSGNATGLTKCLLYDDSTLATHGRGRAARRTSFQQLDEVRKTIASYFNSMRYILSSEPTRIAFFGSVLSPCR